MANTVKMKQSAVAGKVPTTAQLALGELAINTVDGKLFLKKNVGGTESIVDVTGAASGVSSFNTRTGAVTLQSADVTGALGYTPANNASPALSGTPTAPTAAQGTNTTQLATTAFVQAEITADAVTKTSSTGAALMPVGTTAQRPTGAAGHYRFNSTTGEPEWYDTGSGTWVPFGDRVPYTAEYLIVAGGGAGGGGNGAGGGGAGGYRTGTMTVRAGTSNSIVVGAGGAKGLDNANDGSSSSIDSTSAVGGGGGGSGGTASYTAGKPGGSGGGSTRGFAAGSGTSGQGNAGGGSGGAPAYGTGGGGGAGGVGTTGTSSGNGNGGPGLQWLNGSYYAGGGGGGRTDGGLGGITSGGIGGGGGTNTNGTANTGGGGGGGDGYSSATNSGSGGSGVVIIRYVGAPRGTGGTITQSGGYTYHTFTSSGTFTA